MTIDLYDFSINLYVSVLIFNVDEMHNPVVNQIKQIDILLFYDE